MFNRPPPDPTTPIPILIAATVRLYVRTFRPLFVMAALIALVFTVAGEVLLPRPDVEQPETTLGSPDLQEREDVGETVVEEEVREVDLPALFASVILDAVSIGVLSVVLWRAALLHRGEPSSLAAALAVVPVFAPRCFAGAMLLNVPLFIANASASALAVGSGGVQALLALALSVFVLVRTSLYVPAVVLEDRSIAGALVRSWRLVEGRWMRTFLLQLVVGIPIFAVTLAIAVASAGSSAPVIVAVEAVATGVSVPFLSVFGLLLFEDYVRAPDGTQQRQLDDRPPTDEPPR